VQIGKPDEVYERPASVFAANFLGDANVLRGTRVGQGMRLADGTLIKCAADVAIVRPEKLSVSAGTQPGSGNRISGEVLQAVYSGASVTYRIKTAALGDTPLLAFMQNRSGEVLPPGTPVTVTWDPEQTVPVAA
jgi:putative spermidine/putrescine transport system ATP-binding protein/spermidine/putrescine transport system ATP-binding protein